jgi:hypothetical protein
LWIESIQSHERDRFQYFEKRDAGGKPLRIFLIPLSASLKPSRPSSCVVAAQWLALHNASLNTP